MNASAKMERSETVAAAQMWNIFRWAALSVGILVNAWAFWVMSSEIGKELFRFGELPDFSTSTGFLDWCKSFVLLGWLPKDALHVHLYKKLVFGGCNVIFLAVLCDFYLRRNRLLAFAIATLVILNLVLIFSPAVGNLPLK